MTALVAGALIALVAANVYLYIQVDHLRTDLTKSQEKVATDLSNLRDMSSVTTQAQSRNLQKLNEDLEAARNQSRTAAGQAKAEALAHADQLAKQLAAEQAREKQQVDAKIGDVQQTATAGITAANAKISDVSSDVGTVRTQATATQDELKKTIADLKAARGDIDGHSSLIATNGNELQALRRLGERNFFEFKLGKTKTPQRVGDITLMLKKTDPKKNRYSVDVMADDKLTEKKDKNINEPLQFYTARAKQPYELVVNSVQKDQIAGYLATPKEQNPRQ
jgi:hypothetical protein